MSEKLYAAVGQSLIAMGLYTVAFESMVLSFRGGMHEYLEVNDPASMPAFRKHIRTAERTFEFCCPRLVQAGILAQDEVAALTDMRKRRNRVTHEGYNEMLSLSVADVESDIHLMHRITHKVDRWSHPPAKPSADGGLPMRVAPAIFGLYLQLAKEMASLKLPLAQAHGGSRTD